MKKILSFTILLSGLLLSQVSKGQSISEIKDTIVSLSYADIIASNANPIEVLPSLSGGYIYSILDVMASYDYDDSTVYVGGTTLRLYSKPPALPYSSAVATSTSILQATGDIIKKFGIVAGTGSVTQYHNGAPVIFRVEPAASVGTSNMKLFITYQIINLY